MIRDVHPGSGSWIFYPFRSQDLGSWIRNTGRLGIHHVLISILWCEQKCRHHWRSICWVIIIAVFWRALPPSRAPRVNIYPLLWAGMCDRWKSICWVIIITGFFHALAASRTPRVNIFSLLWAGMLSPLEKYLLSHHHRGILPRSPS